MKQYDNLIFVPAGEKRGHFEVRQFGFSPFKETYYGESNVIVCSLEELRECFKWGMDSFEDTQTPAQSFNDFLQSKGIKIDIP